MIRKAVLFIVIIFYLAVGCSETTKTVEKKEITETTKSVMVKDASELQNYEGKVVSVEGKIAEVIWQHLIKSPETHPVMTYFDIGDYQIVVYSKDELGCGNCKCKLKITGTVIKVEGKSKSPKSDEIYTEYHIAADKWECLD